MSESPSLKEIVGKDSESASNSSGSNGEGGGNNSDNSALVSLGNESFGFNFESDGVFNNLSGGSGSNSPDEGDSDQDRKKAGGPKTAKVDTNDTPSPTAATEEYTGNTATSTDSAGAKVSNQSQARSRTPNQGLDAVKQQQSPSPLSAGAAAARLKSESMKSPAKAGLNVDAHEDAAATAVANLSQIAIDSVKQIDENEKRGRKRKPSDAGYEYNTETDDESTKIPDSVKEEPDFARSADIPPTIPATGKAMKAAPGKQKKKFDESKREERNAREKERSFRISKQINELRSLLSSGGVIVPKGTKSSVLTEAANYIRMLQQHQYRSEIDRHQLVQQVQRIGGGVLGPQAAQAVRHVAAQNGVWSLGNFGGVPPKSAMMYHQPSGAQPVADETQSSASSNTVEESDYRHVFNSCTIPMAIASMGGAFIDCNKVFAEIAGCAKQEICSLTVFNLTHRQDLQSAFDLISQMLSAPLDPTVTNTSCVLRGALQNRADVGLSVKLIKGNEGVAKCFCVTLIQNPVSPFDNSRPMPAIRLPGHQVSDVKDSSQQGTPAYTTG